MLCQLNMKSVSTILTNIKNLLPYFLLIAIYFFIVNIEASKDNNIIEKQKELVENKASKINKEIKLRIPVIPYDK